MNYEVDVLAFAAHPDDVELAAGGTVAKLTAEGKKVAIVDFTKGEMGTRGTPEIRIKESQDAANILGVDFRENLGLPDCNLKLNDESNYLVVSAIRKYKPKIVLMNSVFERHPDHQAVAEIVRDSMFKSGLRKFVTEMDGQPQEIHRIRKMFCYQQSYDFPFGTIFYTDISNTFHIKMQSIKAYVSQVWVEGKSDPNGPVTRLSRPEFIEELEAKAITYGTKAGFRYAEAFFPIEPLAVSSLSNLL